MNDDIRDISIPVFSFDEDSGQAFFSNLGLNSGSHAEIPIGAQTVRLELFGNLGGSALDVDSIVEKADAAVVLVKSLDTQSLARIKYVYQVLARYADIPKYVAILRDPRETQFKISCGHCNQSLWIPDRNAGKRGKCVHCRKQFLLPVQKKLVTSSLMVADRVTVQTVLTNGDNCLRVIKALAGQIAGSDEKVPASLLHTGSRMSIMKKYRAKLMGKFTKGARRNSFR